VIVAIACMIVIDDLSSVPRGSFRDRDQLRHGEDTAKSMKLEMAAEKPQLTPR
jgi:hypothetical protein